MGSKTGTYLRPDLKYGRFYIKIVTKHVILPLTLSQIVTLFRPFPWSVAYMYFMVGAIVVRQPHRRHELVSQ